MWAARYVGIPYRWGGASFEGADCYGLAVLAYRLELGVELEALELERADLGRGTPDGRADRARVAAMLEAQKVSAWREVERPQAFDVAVFRILGDDAHVGLIVDGVWMLTTRPGTGALLERYGGQAWRRRRTGVFRLATRCG